MQFYVIVVWFHLKLCTEKEGECFAVTDCESLIRLRSAAIFTIFVSNLVHAYKLHGYLKTDR